MQVCKTLRGCIAGTHVAVTFAALSRETTRGGKPPRKVAEEELEQAFESLAPVTTAVSKVGEGRRKEGGKRVITILRSYSEQFVPSLHYISGLERSTSQVSKA